MADTTTLLPNGKPTTTCNCSDANALGNEPHDQPCPCLCCNPGDPCMECGGWLAHKRDCSHRLGNGYFHDDPANRKG